MQKELQASDGAAGDQLGYVSLDAAGDEALVGAPGHNGTAGAVYAFVRRGGGWVQQQELTASDGGPGSDFGNSVSLDAAGTEALIGAPNKNYTKGAAYVFALGRSGTWAQQQELTASDAAPYSDFGYFVSLNALGNELVVGAPASHSDAGSAYVFALGRSGTWGQQQELTASDGAPGDFFGFSASLNALGTETIVGAPGHNGSAGTAYVFTPSRTGTWAQQQELIASNAAPNDNFGFSVSLDALGTETVVGAPGHNGNAGAVYVFALGRGGTLLQQQELTASDGLPNDEFGFSLSLDALGTETVVGAPTRNGLQGGAYVFALGRSGTLVQQQELTASDGAPNDIFGYTVSLDALGDETIVGAPQHNSSKGAAYVFEGV
jgi:hypothetical protein